MNLHLTLPRHIFCAALLFLAFQPRPARSETIDIAELRQQIARLKKADRLLEAIPLAQELVRSIRQVGGEGDPALGVALNDLGLLYLNAGRIKESVQTLETALSKYETNSALIGSLAVPLQNIGQAYKKAGRFTTPEAAYFRALRIKETNQADDVSIAKTL